MKKLLIVEDEQILRETYELILSAEPYQIHVAADGAQALKLCENNQYDLVLLDLMMPVMDGVTFLEHYFEGKKTLPKVIILSNLSWGDEVTRALDLGALKNFTKSDLSPKQLTSIVQHELRA